MLSVPFLEVSATAAFSANLWLAAFRMLCLVFFGGLKCRASSALEFFGRTNRAIRSRFYQGGAKLANHGKSWLIIDSLFMLMCPFHMNFFRVRIGLLLFLIQQCQQHRDISMRRTAGKLNSVPPSDSGRQPAPQCESRAPESRAPASRQPIPASVSTNMTEDENRAFSHGPSSFQPTAMSVITAMAQG